MREEILAIEPGQGGVSLKIGAHHERFDQVVVCAGIGSSTLLRPLGIKLPLQAVWGYSVSAPVKDLAAAPFQEGVSEIAGIMDERYKVSITRLGNRLRVAGTAELGAKPEVVNEAAVNTLYKVLRDWFPASADLRQAQVWMGARPMLPEGPPVIGATRVPGVWLNTGHGSSGWALACGSADVLADLMQQRSSPLNAAAYAPSRYHL
jgi:D-amino-acid dehydrogenase